MAVVPIRIATSSPKRVSLAFFNIVVLAELETMALAIFERLPKRFRDLCADVVIRIEDFPTDEVLDEMDAETEFDLLGLFQGVGLPQQSVLDVARLPNMVWLYRRPILDYW